MLGSGKISQVNQVSPKSEPKSQKYPSRLNTLSGTTAPTKVYPTNAKAEYSEAYLSAYANMTLLAESSMFVDKLRSMCGDLVVPASSAIASNIHKVEVTIEN
jgi:hypothetical protein